MHRAQATLQALTQEVITISAIEGEALDLSAVRSSIARRLGMDIGALAQADRNVDGERVRIQVGAWRNDAAGPMQVVSGPLGKEKVHYQLPSTARYRATSRVRRLPAVVQRRPSHSYKRRHHPRRTGPLVARHFAPV